MRQTRQRTSARRSRAAGVPDTTAKPTFSPTLKVFVVSCLHVDSTHIGRFDPELGIHTNWHEALSQLKKIVKYCNRNGVDFLDLNGDVFDSGIPTPEAVFRVTSILDELDKTQVIGAPGNHDLTRINARHNDPLSVYFSDKRWCRHISTSAEVVDLDGFQLALMPWFRVSGAREKDNIGIEMADEVKRMADEVARHDGPSLFCGHLTTLTAANSFEKRGSELTSTNVGLEAVLDERVLDDGPWDRYALGHIHKRQPVGSKGKGLYTGSTHRVTFSEENEKKGGYLYAWDSSGDVQVTFVNLGGRKLSSLDLSDLTADQRINPDTVEALGYGDYFRLTIPHDYELDEMAANISTSIQDMRDNRVEVEILNAPAEKSAKRLTSIPVQEEASPDEMMTGYLADMPELSNADRTRIIETFQEVREDSAA